MSYEIHHPVLGPIPKRRHFVVARRARGNGLWMQIGQYPPSAQGEAWRAFASINREDDGVLLVKDDHGKYYPAASFRAGE